MSKVDIRAEAEKLIQNVDTSANLMRSNSEWRTLLAKECQVYSCGQAYLGKRFDEINYQFCDVNTAEEIVRDNLFSLLRFKYFTKPTDEIDERIYEIVKSFTTNLKTTLLKVSFNLDEDCGHVKFLPDYCIAFRNGVYNFKDNEWLFEYDVIKIKQLNSSIYLYDFDYVITWYINIDFKPLELDIMNTNLEDLVAVMRELNKTKRNYCFELMSNMSHTFEDTFSMSMFTHLCEVIGFSVLQSFSQHFVVFVGSGQNGKNSLFDGCLTSRLVPTPASIDLITLENDRFAGGSLENHYQNFYFESSTSKGAVYTESQVLKAYTGSMYQQVQDKNVKRHSTIMNCKIITSANDQDNLKWEDTSTGFRRRINVIELAYTWDENKRFLKRSDSYYDTTFSDSLHEIKDDIDNTIMFIYFAMMGIKEATKGFVENFKFSYNDWKLQYAAIDVGLKEKLEAVNLDKIVRFMNANKANIEETRVLFYSMDKKRLYDADVFKELGYSGFNDMKKMLEDPEESTSFFLDNDVYMNVKQLRQLVGTLDSATAFTQSLKKIYSINNLVTIYNNQPYVKCTFVNRRLKILK